MSTHLHNSTPHRLAEVNTLRRGYADTPEGQIHFVEEGVGEPLLLLHLTPRSSRMYVKLIPFLSPHYRAIAVDLLGYGHSDPPPIEDGVAEAAAVGGNLIHVLDALEIERSHFFGVHTGAFMAAMAAAQSPERIGALIMSGYVFAQGEEEVGSWLQSRVRWSDLATTPDGSHLISQWMRAYSGVQRWWFHARNPPTDPDAPELLRQPSQHRAVHNFLTDEELEFMERWILDFNEARYILPITKSIIPFDREALLPSIKAPTLHIDADSPYETVFCRQGKRVAELIPNCEAVVLPGSDDNMAEFLPRELAEVMLDFLRKHPLGPARGNADDA